jgi:hypothetical protein
MMDKATGLSIDAQTLDGTKGYKLAKTTRRTAQQGCNCKQAKTDLKTRRCPKRSDMEPASMRKLAITRVYASRIDWSPAMVAWRSY